MTSHKEEDGCYYNRRSLTKVLDNTTSSKKR